MSPTPRARLAGVPWVEVGDVRLWCAVDGPAGAPGVLLVHGRGSQGIEWPDDFVAALVAAGRRVVRYDHRDAGASTDCAAAWESGRRYTTFDLADDAARLVRALGLGPVHVVAFSMGGVVAQLAALAHPGLVTGLTLLSSSAAGGSLPVAPLPRYLEVLRPAPGPTPAARVDYLVRLWTAMAGSGYPADPVATRARAERVVARGWTPDRVRRQQASSQDVVDEPPDLSDLAVPTLVVHGDDDPLLPLPHGEALVARLDGARLVTVPGLGHQLVGELLVDLVPDVVGT